MPKSKRITKKPKALLDYDESCSPEPERTSKKRNILTEGDDESFTPEAEPKRIIKKPKLFIKEDEEGESVTPEPKRTNKKPTTVIETSNSFKLPKKPKKRIKEEDYDSTALIIPHQSLTCNDILLGRGNAVSKNGGNLRYRAIVWKYRDDYASATRNLKREIAMKVLADVVALNPPGRFIEGISQGFYREVSEARILEKCCQSLREKKYTSAPIINVPPPLARNAASAAVLPDTTASYPVKHIVKRKRSVKARSNKIKKPSSSRKEKQDIEEPEVEVSNITNDEENKTPEVEKKVEEQVPIQDNASFINAKKLLLGKKVQPLSAAPPLEKPVGFQTIDRLAETADECENDVFDGMFNMLPLSLVEFYSGQGGDDRNSRDKKREESIESPTTVIDDFSSIQPIPLQMTHSLYLEGETKWVNPEDNMTATVVAAWTEFATNGCCA